MQLIFRSVSAVAAAYSRSLQQKLLVKTLLVMKVTAILILAVCLTASAGSITGQTITLTAKNMSLKEIFSAIEKQTGYVVFYRRSDLTATKPVSFKAENQPLADFLSDLFRDKSLGYKIAANTVFITTTVTGSSNGQLNNTAGVNISLDNLFTLPPPVTGIIRGSDGQPLVGATVRVKGKSISILTDAGGMFRLSASVGDIIEITYVGFASRSVTIKEATSTLDIRLEPNSRLDEAIIYNGYQRIQQKYLTGSVTSIKMDSIMQPGLNTVDKMLEGRIPGLTYMINSGQSGAAPKLRIRGTSTILGSREPLWVVDGIVRTDPFPIPPERLNDLDFVNLLGNSVSGINPHDIEQIDVLKDATAAALYGVRAANGVIVITTKRGKPGPPTFNYSVTGTFTPRQRYSDRGVGLMNSAERVDVSREMIQKRMNFRGGTIEGYEKAIMDYYGGLIDYDTYKARIAKAETMNTDWFKAISRDVFATNHTFSVSGGNPVAAYRASLGYTDEPGVIKKEANRRYTGLLNLRITERKFKADFNVSLSRGERNYVPQELGIMNYAYGTSRAIPLYNDDGSLHYYSTVESGLASTLNDFRSMNILNEMNRSKETVQRSEYIASAMINYNIVEGLQFNSTLSFTSGNSEDRTSFDEKTNWAKQLRYPAWDAYAGVFNTLNDPLPFGGELREQSIRKKNYTVNGRLDFSRYIDENKKHLVNAALGGEITSNTYSGVSQIRRGYYPDRGFSFASIDLNTYPAYAKWLQVNGQAQIQEDLQNLVRSFFTATYVYDDRYILTGTASSDFSNAFGTRSNERFLPTWALSGKWNLHNDLLKNVSWIDLAALRLSFGVQGNMLPNQTPYTIIKKGSLDSYFGSFGSSIEAFPNPGLAWEKVHDYNAAVDFSLLNGKLSGSFGMFMKRTTNAFLRKKVSSINGASVYVVNGGTLENKGIELDLHFRPINRMGNGQRRGFVWRIDPQLGQVFNRLLNQHLNTRNVLVDPNSITYQSFLDGSVPIDGSAVNTFYSYQFKGLDPDYGFPVFYSAEPENALELAKLYNTMTKEQVFRTVMVESGKREPVLQGGISNSIGYRNWMLNFTCTYSLGNKVRLMQMASGNYGTFRPSSQQNMRKEFTERWRYPGDEQHTNIPAVRGNEYIASDQYAWWLTYGSYLNYAFAQDIYQMYDFSDLRVVKGDYLKLQYVSLGYDVSPAVCSRWNLKGATISFSGSNLFTIAAKALRGQEVTQSGTAANINLPVRPVYAININLSF